MSELIDRNKALSFPFANLKYDHENADPHFINGCESYKEYLESLAIEDVEPVVRCKDCEYRIKNPFNSGAEYFCLHDIRLGPVLKRRAYKDDWYCADAKRRKE